MIGETYMDSISVDAWKRRAEVAEADKNYLQVIADSLKERALVAEARAELLEKDKERLDWLCEQEAAVGHSRDGDTCRIFWPFSGDSDHPATAQRDLFDSHREAIDAARRTGGKP